MAREPVSERVARLARLEATMAQLGARLQRLEERASERTSALDERLGRLESSLARVLYCSAPEPLPSPPPSCAPYRRKAVDSVQTGPINGHWLSKEVPRTRLIGHTFSTEDLEKYTKSRGIEVVAGSCGARRTSAQLRRAAMRSEARDLERYLGLAGGPGPHLSLEVTADAKQEGPALHTATPHRRHAHDAEVLLC